MSKLSCSFTLGKASSGNANIEHNNREFISSNVDVSRLADNIVYVRQDVREVYDDLFGKSLAEYNEKQKRNDRKIHDYYEHILNGSREEAYYDDDVKLFTLISTEKIPHFFTRYFPVV